MRRVIIAVIVVALCSSARASDRIAKIKALMDAQGLVQLFDEARERSRQRCQEQSQEMMDQMLAGLNASPEVQKQIREAANDFIKAAQATWTSQDIVDEWAKVYGAQFSDEELDQLLAYYTSPLGKKDTLVTRTSLPELSKHFAELSKPIVEQATKGYVARLKEIVQNCNCKKSDEKRGA